MLYGWREGNVRGRGSVALVFPKKSRAYARLVIRKPSLILNCADIQTQILSSTIEHSTMALSSFSAMASVFSIPVHVPSARTQLAFVNMNTDAIHPTRGASVDDIQNQLRKRTESYTPNSATHSTFQIDLTNRQLHLHRFPLERSL